MARMPQRPVKADRRHREMGDQPQRAQHHQKLDDQVVKADHAVTIAPLQCQNVRGEMRVLPEAGGTKAQPGPHQVMVPAELPQDGPAGQRGIAAHQRQQEGQRVELGEQAGDQKQAQHCGARRQQEHPCPARSQQDPQHQPRAGGREGKQDARGRARDRKDDGDQSQPDDAGQPQPDAQPGQHEQPEGAGRGEKHRPVPQRVLRVEDALEQVASVIGGGDGAGEVQHRHEHGKQHHPEEGQKDLPWPKAAADEDAHHHADAQLDPEAQRIDRQLRPQHRDHRQHRIEQEHPVAHQRIRELR